MNKASDKVILLLLMLGLLLTMTACTQKVEDIQDDSMVDKTVKVRGIVGASIKIGSFTGYTLHDGTGNIGVVTSGELPKEGTRVTVKGTLKKLFVYYIEAE